MSIPSFVNKDLENLNLNITFAQLQRLDEYLKLILEANKKVNLTAVRNYKTAWRKLIIDSLSALPGIDNLSDGAKIIDIGTGGGMPGLPLAICRQDLNFSLLDSTGKKIKLIEQWIDRLGLKNVSAIQGRAETVGRSNDYRQKYDIAISRAVGVVSVALEYMLPLVKPGGR